MLEPHLDGSTLASIDWLEQNVVFLAREKLDLKLCSARSMTLKLEVVDLQLEACAESHPLLAVLEVEAGALMAVVKLEECLGVAKEVGL